MGWAQQLFVALHADHVWESHRVLEFLMALDVHARGRLLCPW